MEKFFYGTTITKSFIAPSFSGIDIGKDNLLIDITTERLASVLQQKNLPQIDTKEPDKLTILIKEAIIKFTNDYKTSLTESDQPLFQESLFRILAGRNEKEVHNNIRVAQNQYLNHVLRFGVLDTFLRTNTEAKSSFLQEFALQTPNFADQIINDKYLKVINAKIQNGILTGPNIEDISNEDKWLGILLNVDTYCKGITDLAKVKYKNVLIQAIASLQDNPVYSQANQKEKTIFQSLVLDTFLYDGHSITTTWGREIPKLLNSGKESMQELILSETTNEIETKIKTKPSDLQLFTDFAINNLMNRPNIQVKPRF